MTTTRTRTRKKATKVTPKTMVKPVVTLTLKQAQTIQNVLVKAGKNSKVLENKINSLLV